MFPIDPTPYVVIYAVIVFLCPWAIYTSYLIRELRVLRRNDVIDWFSITGEQWQKIKEFRKTNPESRYLYGKAKQWMRLTFICWVLGFTILAITLVVLSANGLLLA